VPWHGYGVNVQIAMVCPYSLSVPGGVQGQTLGLARALRALGHRCTVIAPSDAPVDDEDVVVVGTSVPLEANGSVAPIAPDFVAAKRTIQALRSRPFDVVHLHEPLVPGPTATALVFWEGPLVGTFHRSGPCRAYSWLSPATRRMAKRLDARCAVSPEAEATAREALGGTYQVLFNGIEVERWTTMAGSEERARPPAIVFVGRHERRKGLSVLIDAFERVQPTMTRALGVSPELWIVGDGPDTEALQARSASVAGLRWLGRLDDASLARCMHRASVLAAPSVSGESFGVVLLEAMAVGTPVVASDLAGYRQAARNGIEALLVPPGDPNRLGLALLRVLRDPALAERLRRAGLSRARALSMQSLAERYVAIYASVERPRTRAEWALSAP
jgi:phosphatidylinositol alpha-mannosyltransferase